MYRPKRNQKGILYALAETAAKLPEPSLNDILPLLAGFVNSLILKTWSETGVVPAAPESGSKFLAGRSQRLGALALLKFLVSRREPASIQHESVYTSLVTEYFEYAFLGDPLGAFDPVDAEKFAYEWATLYAKVGLKRQSTCGPKFSHALWKVLARLVQLVQVSNDNNNNSTTSSVHFYFLHGMIRALHRRDLSFLDTPLTHIHKLITTLVNPSTLATLVRNHPHESTMQITESGDALTLVLHAFALVVRIILTMVTKQTPTTLRQEFFQQIFTGAITITSPAMTDSDRDLLDDIYNLCFDQEWKSIFTEMLENEEFEQGVDPLALVLPEALKCAIVCTFCRKSLKQDLITRLIAYLKEEEYMYGHDVQFDVYCIALNGLGVMYTISPETRFSILEFFKWFLKTPSPIFAHLEEANLVQVLRHCSCSVLATILNATQDMHLVKTTVFGLLNSMYAVDVLPTSSQLVTQNLISAVTTISYTTQAKSISKMVVSSLIRRMEDLVEEKDSDNTNTDMKQFVVRSLVDMAFMTNVESEVLSEVLGLMNLLETKDEEKTLKPVIDEGLWVLAHGRNSGRNDSEANVYFEMVLRFLLRRFVLDVVKMLSTSTTTTTSNTSNVDLTTRLRTIHRLCKANLSFDIQSYSPDTVQCFRDFWIAAIVSNISETATWQKRTKTSIDWTPMMHDIALVTPAFVLESDKRDLVADLSCNSVLATFLPHGEDLMTLPRMSFVHLFSPKLNEIKTLSTYQIVFLLVVALVETYRAMNVGKPESKSPVLAPLMAYLMDERLSDDTFTEVFWSVGEHVVKKFLATTVSSSSLNDSNIIVDDFKYLITLLPHRLQRVRSFVAKTIRQFCATHADLILMTEPTHLVWDIVQVISDQVDNTHITLSASSGMKSIVNESVVSTWDDCDDARQRLMVLRGVLKEWMSAVNKLSSKSLVGLLEAYIHKSCSRGYTSMNSSVGGNAAYGLNTVPTRYHSELVLALKSLNHHGEEDLYYAVLNSFYRHQHSLGQVFGNLSTWSWMSSPSATELEVLTTTLKHDLTEYLTHPSSSSAEAAEAKLVSLIHRCAGLLILSNRIDHDLCHYFVWLPWSSFSTNVMDLATDLWRWVIHVRPSVEMTLLSELLGAWERLMRKQSTHLQKGLYSKASSMKSDDPFMTRMSFAPSKTIVKKPNEMKPHISVIEFLAERTTFLLASKQTLGPRLHVLTDLIVLALGTPSSFCGIAKTREPLFLLLSLGMRVLKEWNRKHADGSFDEQSAFVLRKVIYEAAFWWFGESVKVSGETASSVNHQNSFSEIKIVSDFYQAVKADHFLHAQQPKRTPGTNALTGWNWPMVKSLLMFLVENEVLQLLAWYDPLNTRSSEFPLRDQYSFDRVIAWTQYVPLAWKIHPSLALRLPQRFCQSTDVITQELVKCVVAEPQLAYKYPDAVDYLIKERHEDNGLETLRHLIYWSPATPIFAISLLLPSAQSHPHLLQYAIRVLDHYSSVIVFFYIPQIVQALRYDQLGYVEHYILNTAKTSQLFAHQIIWNMKANMFKDEESRIADPLKPVLDRIVHKIIVSLSGADKDFYEREFSFFSAVTSISGKLKPYIKKSKPEKKKKIDEEMKKIVLYQGVYLPSNPESIVIDIDRESGRPLQSHAKAPFMATFKIRKTPTLERRESLMYESTAQHSRAKTDGEEVVWQSAIFKVGDDCRQDILALQLISVFRSVFTAVGLDLYLFPYRIVATAPGCGVIEVIPKSISRDMMGREKVNNLHDYFINTFGPLHSVGLQRARDNFVKSLAAYSLILYLLQIKDRHNGNIMFDNAGHVIHIDFGFILDIAPGGITFESAPFKLTTEMIDVMGGDANTLAYKRFAELVVQAYLAIRPHAEKIIQLVALMADSGLPCFKGESTIRKLRDRFQLDKPPRAAAEFMVARVRESHENSRTVIYDEFQRLQNGIPY